TVMVVLGLALCLGGGGWGAVSLCGATWEAVRSASEGDYEVVEGPVTNYQLDLKRGVWAESFTVRGVPFSYHEGAVNVGYDRPARRGGLIEPGPHVRIAYRKGVILRLETGDPSELKQL